MDLEERNEALFVLCYPIGGELHVPSIGVGVSWQGTKHWLFEDFVAIGFQHRS